MRTGKRTLSPDMRVSQFLNIIALASMGVITLLTSIILILEIHENTFQDAEERARLILQRNLATHQYFNRALKPSVFQALGVSLSKKYFDPTWMSSTYAVREIDKTFQANSSMNNYAYKEAAINARSKTNEANTEEREFIDALNSDPTLKERSKIEIISGQPYFVLMIRGEEMTPDCLRCHSTPSRAPGELVDLYGSQKSFNRQVGEVASTISIRVPLLSAFRKAFLTSLRASFFVGLALLCIYLLLNQLVNRWLIIPLEKVRTQVLDTAANERLLGEQVTLPAGRELRDLALAFNQLSVSLRRHQDELEERIRERTLKLEQSRHLIQHILDLTPSGLCLLDTDLDRFVYVNQQNADFFGIPAKEFLTKGETFALQFLHPDDLPKYNRLRAELINIPDGQTAETQLRAQVWNGEMRWIAFRGMVVERNENGSPWLILFVADDITEAYAAQEKLRYTSTHDALTGLYNWAYFEEAIKEIKHSDAFPTSVIIMDVDNLKVINDSSGHGAGDALLHSFGLLLLNTFRVDDVVARIGGDEFAALLPNVDQDAAWDIVQRLRSRLNDIDPVSGLQMDRISIGVCTANSAADLDTARREADSRMYADKNMRKSK